jgi:hypothetical protein
MATSSPEERECCALDRKYLLSNCPKWRAASLAFRYAINFMTIDFMTMGSRPLLPTSV